MQTEFYVYEWFNTETNEVFYVGKGCGNRYRSKQHRNKDFLDYVENNPTDVRIVKVFQDEEEAFKYEKELTDYYRSLGMCKCSLMDGGYGGYNKVWTPEMRAYMSKYNPMKSEAQRKRMSEHNPMKDPEIAMRVGSTHKRKVVLNGKEYSGVKDAANILGVAEYTVTTWCKRGYDTDGNPCRYADEEQKEYKFKKGGSKEVEVDGIIYSSVKEAATALGCKDSSPLCKALKAGRQFKGHNVKYVNQQPNQ